MATMNDMRKAVGKPVQAAPVKQQAPKSVMDIIQSEGFRKQMALALPKTLTAERMTRIVMTEIRKTPALMQCDQASLLGAVMQAAQLGLEPGGALGHCYLLPFGNGKSKTGQPNAQLIIGYRGMLDLARRSGQIQSFSAFTVHEGDEFHYELGLRPDIKHIPSDAADRDSRPINYVYAVANLKDGGVQFEVMSRAAIEAVRMQSKAGKSGPWVTHWEEMAKKTCLRRLFKYLPISIEAARAIQVDENTDRGISVDYVQGAVVDVTPEAEALPEPEAVVAKNETTPQAKQIEPDPETGEVAFTAQQVEAMIHSAKDLDQLSLAMDAIRSVPQEHQEALWQVAQKREGELA